MAMRRWLALSLCFGLAAGPSAAAARDGGSRYDGSYFDGSRDHRGAVRARRAGSRSGFWSDPDKGRLRVAEGRFKPRGVPAAARAQTAKAKAKAPPHFSWDWNKTVIAAGAGLAGAALALLLFTNPIMAAVGFLGGMFVGAIAANAIKKEEKKDS
jgi:hypothetical protein